MDLTRLILIGGFLGAGKTTLVARASKLLARRGLRVGIVTNDQASDLVDTGLLRQDDQDVAEVAGGCFCCRFEDFFGQMKRLKEELKPDILIGEPVGSCTDLSATVLQPLKKIHGDVFRTAPFSVLVDPLRLAESLQPRGKRSFPDSVLYIFRLQMEESDLIIINKADLVSPAQLLELKAAVAQRYPNRPILTLSALTGEGVEQWLDLILQDAPAGQRIATVDYDTYAEGEAVLGWLNASVSLQADSPADWQAYCLDLLSRLRAELQARSAEIAHAKLLLTAPGGFIAANLTSTAGQPAVRGVASPSPRATLVVNVRAHIRPDDLRQIVEGCLKSGVGGVRSQITTIQSFSPSRPNPTHRFDTVVA